MARESDDTRHERLLRYIETVKARRCDKLVSPLEKKLQGFREGKVSPEELFKAAERVGQEGKEFVSDFKKRPEVILAGIAMDQNRYVTDIGEIGVKLRHGSLTAVFVDAVIVPAGADGLMAAGAAKALKEAGGEEIEREAVAQAPIAPGTAVSTGAGELPNLHVIHATTASGPEGGSTAASIKKGIAAALRLADGLECETAAMPLVGAGTGGLPPAEAARVLVETIAEFEPKNLFDIILIDSSEDLVEALEKTLEAYDEENE